MPAAEARQNARVCIDILEARELLSMSPDGMTPAQIRHAYRFDREVFAANGQPVAADGAGQTIAIVTAWDDPYVWRDLQVFDQQFGLPSTDGTGAAALSVVKWKSTYVDENWALETSLDVQWAHAIAPGAHMMLVEARTSSLGDMLNAVDFARQQPGVSVVSMSWGLPEFVGQTQFDGYFTTPPGHAGVSFVAASGDVGGESIWPSASPAVLSVGGTGLTVDAAGNYLSERAWGRSGGGYSPIENRNTPDVAYSARVSTGFPVYDSLSDVGQEGWYKVGGTSAGAPQWAALVAIANQGRALAGKGPLDGGSQLRPAIAGMDSAAFNDITVGTTVYPTIPGYDFTTGRGTPKARRLIDSLVAYDGPGSPGQMAVPATGPNGLPAAISQLARLTDPPSPSAAAGVARTPFYQGPTAQPSLLDNGEDFAWTSSLLDG